MRIILLVLIAAILPACGTIKSQDYTDLAIEKAVLDARVAAAEQANIARAADEERTRQAIRMLLEQLMYQDGRRIHRPGAGT